MSGERKRILCAKSAPPDAHDGRRPKMNAWSLKVNTFFATGLGRDLILADCPQHAAPRGLDRSFHRQEEERQNSQNHDQVEVVVVLG